VSKRIAVVAVHGVANQEPDASAKAIAAMLSGLDFEYSAFTATEIQLPLRPVRLGPPGPVLSEKASPGRLVTWGAKTFEERREYLTYAAPAPREMDERDESEPAGDLANAFARMQLGDYEGTSGDRLYQTRVLSSERAAAPGSPARQVDVYEMYWADLSRLSQGPLAFFGALYQLVLHAATLGRQAVDDAAHEHDLTLPWELLSRAQRYAVRCLTLPIPLLNLILMMCALAAFPAEHVGESLAAGIAVVVGGIAGAGGGYLWERGHVPRTPLVWSWVPFVSAAVGGVVVFLIWRLGLSGFALLGVAWWALTAVVVEMVASAYETFRNGATFTARLLLAASFAAFLLCLWLSYSHAHVDADLLETATLWTMEIIFLALTVVWIILFVSALSAFILGAVVVRRESGDVRARARAAVRTGRLTLSLSSGAFLAVTIVIWCGVFAYARDKGHVFEKTVPSRPPIAALAPFIESPETIADWIDAESMRPTASDSIAAKAAGLTTQTYIRGLLVVSVSTGAPLSMVVASAALLILVWMALPSIRAESVEALKCTNEQSVRMGRWLSRGLDATSIVTMLLWWAAFVIPAAFWVVDRARRAGWHAPWPLLDHAFVLLTGATAALLTTTGTFLAASAVLFISGMAKIGGTALDVMLDVDNYLRTAPATATPRAKISERYVSLLRYLASDEPVGGRYDAIVIVAHSLGALITIDLLRLLEREVSAGGDPQLASLGFGPDGDVSRRIGLHVLTLGCPLRQLLNRFFPHRYRWVRERPDNSAAPLIDASSFTTPTVLLPVLPDVSYVGVDRWDNAYRSGDYVGRAMWLEEWYCRNANGPGNGDATEDPLIVADPGASGKTPVRYSEMCIGVGAHTHYWDHTAPDIATHIDYMVVTS
jgi:hypothetical protein